MSDDLYDGPCEAGCISFHGGERKHHKDCGHYPHSLTKVNADRIEELEALRDALGDKVRKLTTLLDDQFGTPCEQIRHKQEVEELEAKLATLEDAARSALEYVEHNEKEWGVNLAMGNKLRAALAALQGDKT